MKAKTKKKKFDCLENKWRIQEQIYDETKNMTDKEIIQYFNKSVEESHLSEWLKKIKKNSTINKN